MSYYTASGFQARCEHCGALLGRNEGPLTPRQARLYRFLDEWIACYDCAPSFEEIARQFGYKSLATVHEHLGNLERKGWIKRRFNKSRAIECLVRVA